MFSDQARAKSQNFVNSIAAAVHKTGVTPNQITIVGCSFMCFIGFLVSQGYLALGGFLIIFASGFDALDGAVARLTKQVTKFGGFLDSVTDRYAEFAIFLGQLHYLISSGYNVLFSVYLVMFALFGSVMVSYNRARAEGLAFECKGGLFSRFERLVVMIAGLILTLIFGDYAMIGSLFILAIFANITAIQRIFLVYEIDSTTATASA